MCFVFEVRKKMRAEMSCKMSVLLPSEMAWSLSYDALVFEVRQKMRAEMFCTMSVLSPSETAWSQSYDMFCVRGKKKDARRNVLQNECTITF